MAATVLGAVVGLIDDAATDLGIVASGGLWVGEIPEDKAPPFVAVLHLGETPSWTFEKSYIETTTLELHTFAVGVAAAEALALLLKNVLDWTGALSVLPATVVGCKRTGYTVSLATFRDEQGRLVFDATTTYEIQIVRKLPR